MEFLELTSVLSPVTNKKLSWIIDDNGYNDDQDWNYHPVYRIDDGSSTDMEIDDILDRFIRIGVERMKTFAKDEYLDIESLTYYVEKYRENEYGFNVVEDSTTLMNLYIESEFMFSESIINL
jgi:hypothetical protein